MSDPSAVLSDPSAVLSDPSAVLSEPSDRSSNIVIFPWAQFISLFDCIGAKVSSSFNPSLNICCSNIKGFASNLLSITHSISVSVPSVSRVHFVINSSGYDAGRSNWILLSICVLVVPIILNSPFSEHELSSIFEGVNIIGNLDLFSSTEKSSNNPFLIASAVSTGSNNVLSSGIPATSSVWLNSKDVYVFVVSNSAISQLKSAWDCPFVGFTSSTRVQVACDKAGSSFPFSSLKCKNKVIWNPCWIVCVVKPKNLNIILSLAISNLFNCLKDKDKSKNLCANFNSPFMQFIGSVLNPVNKNCSSPRVICSNIKGWLFITPENLHSIIICFWAFDIGIVHTASTPGGNNIGIRMVTSSWTSPPILPIILKVPSDSLNEVSIESITSIFGTFSLFSSKE